MTERDLNSQPTESWRLYRDPASVPPHICAHCGEPIRVDAYAMLADARQFCSSECYESWVRR